MLFFLRGFLLRKHSRRAEDSVACVAVSVFENGRTSKMRLWPALLKKRIATQTWWADWLRLAIPWSGYSAARLDCSYIRWLAWALLRETILKIWPLPRDAPSSN